MKQSQVSMEILMAVGFILLLFGVITFINFEQKSQAEGASSVLDKKSLCNEIANSIDRAYSGGDGTIINIKRIEYGVFINPDKRVVEVFDRDNPEEIVTCTIPIEKIVFYDTNGTHYDGNVTTYLASLKGFNNTNHPYFTINAASMQFENVNGRVFICYNCSLNLPDFSEAKSVQGYYVPVTNIVREYDDETIAIMAAERSVNPEGPGTYRFNVAYVKLGGGCLMQILRDLGYVVDDECKKYSKSDCTQIQTKCDYFESQNVIRDCLFGSGPNPNFINWYTLILYEDYQLMQPQQMAVFEDRISRAGWALISGKILQANEGDAFGAHLFTTYGTGPATKQNNDPEGLLELPRSTITFTGTGSSTNPYGLTSHTTLYSFDNYPGYDAVSRWKYPDSGALYGDVYYFNNYCDMKDELTVLIENILSIQYFTYLMTDFRISKEVGKIPTSTSVNLLVSHEITNPNYQFQYAWLGEIAWCDRDVWTCNPDIAGHWTVIPVDENGNIEGTGNKICENQKSEYNNPKIAKCIVDLGSPDIENIRLRLKFVTPSGGGQAPVVVDMVQLEACS